MIFDRLALYGVGGALIVALGLAGTVKLGEMARTRERNAAISERNASDDWGDKTCGYVRSSYRVYDVHTGKPRPRKEWGVECSRFVLAVQQRVDGEAQRLAEALQAHQREQDAKYAADLAAARRNASRRSDSLKSLEAADAAITNGHYPDRWWMALGDTLGLRPAAEAPALAEPGPAGGGGEGAPAH